MRLIFTLLLLIPLSLPAAELISAQSAEGIKRLERAEAKVDFLPLANHFESQENKLFCGIASSVIVLNTLRLENREIQKPQDPTLLSSQDRAHLPKNFDPIYERYTQRLISNSAPKSREEILGKPVTLNGKKINDYGLQLKQLTALLRSYNLEVTERVADASISDEKISKELIQNLKTANDYVLVNYSRRALNQGDMGHISPLGAYDKTSDSFLIMDVNPNTAGWIWIPRPDLIAAMRTFDTEENRGYVLVREGKGI